MKNFERVWQNLPPKFDGAAGSTIEALAYQLRAGFSALRKPSAQARLFELNKEQVSGVAKRLSKFRQPQYVPWAEKEIAALLSMWRAGRGANQI
jgi:hypothetical protein